MNNRQRTTHFLLRTKNYELRTREGFSLTEVLMAVGILSVGMLFIAGVFPVAVYFATIATERTTAAVAADEAFAKVQLYSSKVDLTKLDPNKLANFNDVLVMTVEFDPNDFTYPSIGNKLQGKNYFWSALCRRVGVQLVQVTVFVSRKTGANLRYYAPDPTKNPGDADYGRVRWPGFDQADWPVPIKVGVAHGVGLGDNELEINVSAEKKFINDGCTIVDDETGRIYRVLERYKSPNDNTILLDKDWLGGANSDVWVVPPPVNGSRYPCVAVYQKVIEF